MKKLFVTIKRLRRAVRQVERELKNFGLWHPNMQDTQVYLIPAHVYYGYEQEGDIYIPFLTLGALFSKRSWTLLDLVRHDYGHVVSEYLSGWEDVFDAEESVTRYGETNPDEDFAEFFRYFLKYRGKLPKKWQKNAAIRQKWKYLQGL